MTSSGRRVKRLRSCDARRWLVGALCCAVLAGCGDGGESDPAPSGGGSASATAPDGKRQRDRDPHGGGSTKVDSAPPLKGKVVVLDPGHQLGNASFPAEINAPVDAGGVEKACNTTGTATGGGYAEATLVWEVAVLVRDELERAGATVLMTRERNSADLWGPCIDERGRAGNPDEPGPTADLKLSIHADGSLSAGAHGFHVISPPDRAPWTDDIAAPSRTFAEEVRDALVAEGFAVSTYTADDGLDVRDDLGTLNLADVPTAMVELGNMRDPGDAAVMTSPRGRERYARGLTEAILRFLTL